MYFLDTNTCIYFLNGTYLTILNKLKQINNDQIIIPSIVKAELLYGAEKSKRKTENLKILNRFLKTFATADFDSNAAKQYSEIRISLEKSGKPVGPNDLLIASIVKANNGILITHNTKEFSQIANLHLEDWAQ